MNDEELLDAENSPKTVSRNTRGAGKRVNRIPYVIVAIAILIFGYFAVLGIIKRMEPERRNSGLVTNSGASAIQSADEFLFKTRGMIPAKQPDPVVIPEPPKAPDPIVITEYVPIRREKTDLPAKVEPTPTPDAPPAPEPVKVDPELLRIKKQRLMLAERAINSRIIVQKESSTTTRATAPASSYDNRYANAQAATTSGTGVSLQSASYESTNSGDLSAAKRFDGPPNRWESRGEVEAPKSPYMLLTGTVIPATLISGLNSELPGQILAQVSQNVYDSATGRNLLVPQGSRLIGEYLSNVQYGQSRVFAVWQRIVFPDGKTLDMGAMPASTGAGYAGLKDRVNNHYFRIFGSALMMSAVIAGVEVSQDNNNSNSGDKQRMGDAMSAALGNTLGNVMAEMIRKNMAIAPTIEIRPGFRLNVMLVKDLEFKRPYKGFDYIKR